MTVYNAKYECIFVNVPRCASGSMSAIIGGGGHKPMKQFKKQFESEEMGDWDKTFRFGFCRHPYERFVSAYCNLRYDLKYDINTFIENEVHMKKLFNNQRVLVNSCSEYLCDDNGALMVNFLGRFENFKADWGVIARVLKITDDLPHNNQTNRAKPILGKKAKQILYDIYNNDFQKFGYLP